MLRWHELIAFGVHDQDGPAVDDVQQFCETLMS
jgi:hypothetical protein